MRNKELFAQAEQFPEDFQPPVPTQPADTFPEDFLGPGEIAPPTDPFPVQQRDLSPREWFGELLSNLPGSAWQNVLDMASLFRPWGKRASGETTAVPGVADLVRLVAESQMRPKGTWNPVSLAWSEAARGYVNLDEHVFGGTQQSGNETPMVDAFADYFLGRYDFTKPEVRNAFEQVLREDPVGVITDIATVASLGAGGGGAAAGAARAGGKVGSKMNRVLRVFEGADRVVNQGFHVPGVPRKINTGLADLVDPGVWAVRGANRAAKETGQKVRQWVSAVDKVEPDDIAAMQESLVTQGFTDNPKIDLAPDSEDLLPEMMFPEDSRLEMTSHNIDGIYTPLSMINRQSDSLLRSETRRYDRGMEAVVESVQKTGDQFSFRMNRILRRAHESGDLAEAAEEMGVAYQQARQNIMDELDRHYQEAGATPGLVVDMRPVYTTLQQLREQDMRLSRLTREPETDYVPFADDPQMRRVNEHVDELARLNQNRLTPDFLEGNPQAQAATPQGRSSGASTAKIEDDLYGTPTRESRDLNTNISYATTYRIVDLKDLVTSHVVETTGVLSANANPAYDATLQVKDMNTPSQLLKVQTLAKELWPEQLGGSLRTIQEGTMITDSDLQVISGNHRAEALRLAIVMFPDNAQAYRDRMPAEADRFGLDVDLDAMDFPVLIRVLDDDVDKVAFARAANVSDVSQLSETAQAGQDLHILTDDMFQLLDAGAGDTNIDDVIRASSNNNFRQQFIGKLSDSETPQFVSSGNELSQQGVRRVANALTAKVFDGNFGTALRSIFTEGASEGFKNIRRGIQGALPALIQLREYMTADRAHDYNIAEPLAEAILKLKNFRETETSGKGVQAAINTYLDPNQQQGGLFGDLDDADAGWQARELDERGRDILRVLATGVSNPTMLRDFLREYVARVQRGTAATVDAAVGRATGQETIEPPEVILNDLATKYVEAYAEGASDELKEGLAALFQYSDEAAAAGGDVNVSTDTKQPTKLVEPASASQPVLFENVIAYRDALVEAIQSGRGGTRARNWRAQLVAALDTAVMDTLRDANPQKAYYLPVLERAVTKTQEALNSSFARLAADLLSGARNPNDPAVQKAMRTIFTPNDTPDSVIQKYQLLGGWNSDASKRVRRVKLGELFDFIHTEEGTADAAAIIRGDQEVSNIADRYRADGIQKYLNQFMTNASEYGPETLAAIFGMRTVDDLYELDAILQAFGRFMDRGGKNELFFGERVRSRIMSRITEHLGWQLAGAGLGSLGGGALSKSLPFIGALAAAGMGGALAGKTFTSWVFNQMYESTSGRRLLVNGIEWSWRQAWDAGSRVLLRNKSGEPAGAVVTNRQTGDEVFTGTQRSRKERRDDFVNNPDADTRQTARRQAKPPSAATVRTGLKTGRLVSKSDDDE